MGTVNSMDLDTLIEQINLEFREFHFGNTKFPLLFSKGLDNSSIHAAGVSYLLALGIEFGLSSIAEYPITIHADNHWKTFGKIIPDVVWFHPNTHQPWIVFEFERFEKGDELKIEEKAKNLALSYYQSKQSIEVCVLIYWLRSGFAPKTINPITTIFSNGFSKNRFTIPPPKCRFLVYKFILRQTDQIPQSSNANKIGEAQGIYHTDWENNGNLVVSSVSKVLGGTE